MNSHLKFTFTFIVFVCLLGSCNKDNEANNESTSSSVPKIAAQIYNYGSDNECISTYQYDSKGRVIREIGDGNRWFVSYEYNGTSVIAKGYYSDGEWFETETYQLNSRGLVESYSLIYHEDGFVDFNFISTYEYDDNGYCKSMTSYNDKGQMDSKTTYTVLNGNTISSTYESFSLEFSITSEYQFFTDKLNTIGDANFGLPIKGKHDRNLIKEVKSVGTYYNGSNYTTYEFDTQVRVTKRTGEEYIKSKCTGYTYVK